MIFLNTNPILKTCQEIFGGFPGHPDIHKEAKNPIPDPYRNHIEEIRMFLTISKIP